MTATRGEMKPQPYGDTGFVMHQYLTASCHLASRLQQGPNASGEGEKKPIVHPTNPTCLPRSLRVKTQYWLEFETLVPTVANCGTH